MRNQSSCKRNPKMKCNIAEFIGTIQDGGAETLVKDYAIMLDREKFNVNVIVLRRTKNTANDKILSENKDINIINIYKNNSILFKVIQKLNQWWYIPYRLYRILEQEHIEVLHIHMALLKYVAVLSNKIKQVKLCYTCHSTPIAFLGKRGAIKYEHWAAKQLLHTNHLQMIALHNDMRREINEMFNIDNTIVIRNAINFNRFKNIAETKEAIRVKIGIPTNAFVVGHIGRFSSEKNHDFLIEVFNEVANARSDAFLLLVGAGSERARIEQKIWNLKLQDRVLIFSNRTDIPQLMRSMDVFVFPSKVEGFGIVLIEAQVSGVRCIVSDSVPKETFQTELAVPISLKESPEKWAEIVLDDSIKGKRDGNIDDYDMNKEIKRLEKLYLS